MQAELTHVAYKLPNKHTWVGSLISSIEKNDVELQSAIASVKQDKTRNGLGKNFKYTVPNLLPANTVSKKQVKGSKHRADIYSMKFEQN